MMRYALFQAALELAAWSSLAFVAVVMAVGGVPLWGVALTWFAGALMILTTDTP